MPESLYKLESQKPSAFFPRLLQVSTNYPLTWPCTSCPTDVRRTKCEHVETCTECSNYQIEKILRCEACCRGILNFYPPVCGPRCSRVAVTQKSTAKCDTCGHSLRKRCSSCKKDPAFQAAKAKLKKQVRVFVTAVSSLQNVNIRPCSHCRVCIMCNDSLTKGHRERAVCASCKTGSAKSSPYSSRIGSPSNFPTSNPEFTLREPSSPDGSPTQEERHTLAPLRSILRESSSEVENTSFLVKRTLPCFASLAENLPEPFGKIRRTCEPSHQVNDLHLRNPWSPMKSSGGSFGILQAAVAQAYTGF